jgi:hypothetical protein
MKINASSEQEKGDKMIAHGRLKWKIKIYDKINNVRIIS